MAVSNSERGFQDCLKSFQARLTPQERDDFRFATLQDLKHTILQIQAKQAAKSKNMNLTRVLRFLEAFEQWGLIVDVFLNSSELVAFVWGPMKFLLQVAGNFAHAFDTLLSAYEQIGESLPLFEQFRSLFGDNTHMREALSKIYEDILEFHRRALRFFTIPTWKQVFRSVWKDFNTRFDGILKDLQRHKLLIESQASLSHYQQYQMDRQKLFNQLDQLEKAERKKQYSDLLHWLAGVDYILDHEEICKKRQGNPKSGTWLLGKQTYESWRRDTVPPRSMLWLKGIPGAGKTVLSSLVVENCKEDKGASTVFFYCKYEDLCRTRCVSILSTLLNQFLTVDHDLVPWLYDQHLLSGQLTLSSEVLCKDLLSAVLQITPKIYIVIDGLDECDRPNRKSLLNILSEMVTLCDDQDPGKLRVMIVSQDESDIGRNMLSHSEIQIQSNDNARDIELFTQSWCTRIQEKFELSDQERDSVVDISSQRADGMFLFAKLVMEHLFDQVDLDGLMYQLEPHRFPRGIEQAYQRIFDRILQRPPQEQQLAQTILGWMICARRQLRWHEIQGVFAVDMRNINLRYSDRRPRIHIREICGPLINELTGDRLDLVHHTAKHYLTSSMFIQRPVVECRLTTICLRYLTSDCFDTESSIAERRSCLLNGDFAFQEYAAVHWSDHLLSVIKRGPDVPREEFSKLQSEFSAAVTDFAAQYQLFGCREGLRTVAELKAFHEFEFHDDLGHIYEHILHDKRQGDAALDEIRPAGLKSTIMTSRNILEELDKEPTVDLYTRNQLISFYGTKWYKCSKGACYYFHEGFVNDSSRVKHVLRHEKPFRCMFQDCETGYKLGFTKQKDLEKHMVLYHAEIGTGGKTFLRPNHGRSRSEAKKSPSSTIHPATHKCDQCGKSFTRANILKAHKSSHEDEKPFKCNICNIGFGRDGDRRRHEQSHQKNFTCGGRLRFSIPPKDWGCGKAFARADALASHHRTVKGKACLASFLEEQRLEQQRQSVFEGGNLPVPEAILQMHPDFQTMTFGQLMNQSLNDRNYESSTPASHDIGSPADSTQSFQPTSSLVQSSTESSHEASSPVPTTAEPDLSTTPQEAHSPRT